MLKSLVLFSLKCWSKNGRKMPFRLLNTTILPVIKYVSITGKCVSDWFNWDWKRWQHSESSSTASICYWVTRNVITEYNFSFLVYSPDFPSKLPFYLFTFHGVTPPPMCYNRYCASSSWFKREGNFKCWYPLLWVARS